MCIIKQRKLQKFITREMYMWKNVSIPQYSEIKYIPFLSTFFYSPVEIYEPDL